MAATKNPRGYKSEKPWRDALTRAGKRRINGKTGPRYLDKMADACVEAGADGNVAAMKEYGDRVEGKAVQGVELGGKDGGPIQLEDLGTTEAARRIAFILASAIAMPVEAEEQPLRIISPDGEP